LEHPLIKNILFTKSIKFRAILFILSIFTLSIWALSFFAHRTLQDDIEQLVSQQQFTTVHMVAEKVNEQLINRTTTLQGAAKLLNSSILADKDALQAFMDQRPGFKALFNAGYFITDAQGTAQASYPESVGRLGRNYMDLPHIAATLKDGKARISAPLIGKLLKTPVFHIVVPIRSAQGEIIGSLIGAINLSRPSFLDNITNSPYGKTGGYVLIHAPSRIIITATDKSRIMEVLVSGFNPLVDRVILGMKETGVVVDTKRIEVLISGHNIPVANWRIIVSLPTKEAFAPIKDMQTRMFFVTLVVTLLVGFLTWWVLRRELSPLLDTAHTLANIPPSGILSQPLNIAREDEVGELIGGFNRLLDTLSQRQAALAESEERFRSLADAAPTLIWVAGTDKLCNWFNHT
jgi:HAMP domain-containing protein